jgi:hypothetical protein
VEASFTDISQEQGACPGNLRRFHSHWARRRSPFAPDLSVLEASSDIHEHPSIENALCGRAASNLRSIVIILKNQIDRLVG